MRKLWARDFTRLRILLVQRQDEPKAGDKGAEASKSRLEKSVMANPLKGVVVIHLQCVG